MILIVAKENLMRIAVTAPVVTTKLSRNAYFDNNMSDMNAGAAMTRGATYFCHLPTGDVRT